MLSIYPVIFGILAILAILARLVILVRRPNQIETFVDQTLVPTPHPAGLSQEFQSPKSSLKNYNETTTIHQDTNQLQPHNSNQIGHYQQLPDWVYPYTYINRRFDTILMTLAHKIEKDYNKNLRLNDPTRQDWNQPYPYQIATWNTIEARIKEFIIDVIGEINRRFNTDVPIVGVLQDQICYHWVSPQEVIMIVKVYKRYTVDDIKYFEGTDPNINQHLKYNFERDLVIGIDHIGPNGYHIKYMRFPTLDYANDPSLDEMPYINDYDHLFYIGLSKDPNYRMLTNTEARDLYIVRMSKPSITDYTSGRKSDQSRVPVVVDRVVGDRTDR
jgi:hypothetical protein